MRNVAIITGASSGIGEAFVREIVKERGVYGSVPFQEIWIIARREERLNKLRDELDPARIIPFPIDLAEPSQMQLVEDKLAEDENTRVGLIVNCAGMGKRGLVEDKSAQVIEDTVDVNCTCLSKLTRICLPYMITPNPVFPRRDGPRIINIASSAAFLPQPGFAAYAASKAYVVSFSRALDIELMPYKICVTTVCPGPVNTEFQTQATDGRQAEFTGFRAAVVADPVKLAVKSLKASRRGRHLFVYGFSQKALHVASKIIPTYWLMRISNAISPARPVAPRQSAYESAYAAAYAEAYASAYASATTGNTDVSANDSSSASAILAASSTTSAFASSAAPTVEPAATLGSAGKSSQYYMMQAATTPYVPEVNQPVAVTTDISSIYSETASESASVSAPTSSESSGPLLAGDSEAARKILGS